MRVPADHGANIFNGAMGFDNKPAVAIVQPRGGYSLIQPHTMAGTSALPMGPEVDTANTTLSQYG